MKIAIRTLVVVLSAWGSARAAVSPNAFETGSDSDRIEAAVARAVESGGVSGAGHVLALIAANGGVAALFGLLFHTAVRTLGWWRGRLHRWWLAIAALTVVVGAAGWLLDSSLPRW